MPSDRYDILTGIGTLASGAIAVYGWLYSIGLAQLFMFVAGACFTMFTQERLDKRRRKRDSDIKMTEHIYGPLHNELNSLLVNLENFQAPTGGSLIGIMKDFRFNLVNKKLRYQIREFQERLEPYHVLLIVAQRETESHLMRGKVHNVRFDVWAGGDTIFQMPMIEPIFQDKTPLDFLAEKVGRYQDVSMIVYINNKSEGRFSSEHRIHQISMDILTKVREDPTVQRQRREREYLLDSCDMLIKSVEKKIIL